MRIWQTRQAIRAETDAVAQELTGTPVLEPLRFDDDLLMMHALMTAILGPLSQEETEKVAMAAERSRLLANELEELPAIAGWREAQRLKRPLPALPEGVLSPDQQQTFAVSMIGIRMVIEMHSRLKAFTWTPAELRRASESLARVLPGIVSVEDTMDKAISRETLEQCVISNLSPARAQEWRRSMDKDYADALECMKDAAGGPEIAARIYSIKEQTEAAWVDILTNRELADEQRATLITELRAAAARAVQQTLGDHYRDFAGEHRQWMMPAEASR